MVASEMLQGCDKHRDQRRLGLQMQTVFFISYGCWPGNHVFSELDGPCLELPLRNIWGEFVFGLLFLGHDSFCYWRPSGFRQLYAPANDAKLEKFYMGLQGKTILFQLSLLSTEIWKDLDFFTLIVVSEWKIVCQLLNNWVSLLLCLRTSARW